LASQSTSAPPSASRRARRRSNFPHQHPAKLQARKGLRGDPSSSPISISLRQPRLSSAMSSSLLSPVSPQLEKARTSTTIKTSCFSYLTPTRSPLARSRTRSTCPSPSPTSINSTHSSDISRLASSPSASTTSSSDDSWTPPSLPPGFLDLVKLASTTSPDSSFEVSAAGDEEEETSMAFPPEQKMPAQRSGALKEEGQRKPTKSGDDGPRTVQRMDSLVKLRKSRSRTFEGKLDGLDELAMVRPSHMFSSSIVPRSVTCRFSLYSCLLFPCVFLSHLRLLSRFQANTSPPLQDPSSPLPNELLVPRPSPDHLHRPRQQSKPQRLQHDRLARPAARTFGFLPRPRSATTSLVPL
jgi:hypothetical protein